MVPATLRNKPDEVLAVVMYGAELGIGPMQALQQVNFVAGKPSASAELLRALVMEAGHQFILSGNNDEAIAQCRRKDWDEWRETRFTISDARRAGLTSGDNWKKYPDQMLAARVTSKACRMYFADVISGMSYTPEEVESFAVHTPESSRPTTRNVTTVGETGEVATDDQYYSLTTSISLLDNDDKARLKALWIEAGLPSLQRGLTKLQAERATQLVTDVLDKVNDDVADAEVVTVSSRAIGDDSTPTNDVVDTATKFQVKAIHTLLSNAGVGPVDRHGVVGTIIGRSIDSMNDLTKLEASTVIDRLTADAEARASDENHDS